MMGRILALLFLLILVPLVGAHGGSSVGEGTNVAEVAGMKVEMSQVPAKAIVGTPSALHFTVTDAVTGAPVENAQVFLAIHHIEHDFDTVTAGPFTLQEGEFDFTYHFWDGAEHTVSLDIEPEGREGGRAEFLVEVIPQAPPVPVRMKGLFLLLFTVVVGYGIGYPIGRAKAS
jgi:hypothetical protein